VCVCVCVCVCVVCALPKLNPGDFQCVLVHIYVHVWYIRNSDICIYVYKYIYKCMHVNMCVCVCVCLACVHECVRIYI